MNPSPRQTIESTTPLSNLGPFEIAVMIEECERSGDTATLAVACVLWQRLGARGEVPTSPDIFRRSLERLEANTDPTVEVWA